MKFHRCRFFSISRVGRTAAGLLGAWVVLAGAETPASDFTAQDVNTMLNAYSNAFYSLSGTNAYFKNTQTGGAADFWKQAEEIECISDACERTSNATCKVMVARLLNGFAKNHGTNWTSNIYNDDCMWACMAFARGYLDTGDPRFRDVARWNFDRIYDRAWDGSLGGGLYWTTGNHSKNACVNGPAGIAAFLLYQICADAGYLTRAASLFKWERSVLFNPDTGAVSDNINTNGRIHAWTSTYNQGTFIGLANFLGFTNDAVLAANYTKDNLTVSGTLPPYGIGGNNSGFNAIFLRWMARFVRDRGLQIAYEPWLQDNANAAWNVRRISDNLSWCQWQQPTPTGTNLHSWDCIASLEALQAASPAPGSRGQGYSNDQGH